MVDIDTNLAKRLMKLVENTALRSFLPSDSCGNLDLLLIKKQDLGIMKNMECNLNA